MMDEKEKIELNKQKKLVDCINHLNSVLQAFERLENYKARTLPIIDGFDMTHSDTYFKLTEDIKPELFNIKFFSNYAAKKLVEYRRLCNPDLDIYSVKEKKNYEKNGIKPIGDWRKQSQATQHLLNEIQKDIDKMQEKRKTISSDEVNFPEVEDIKERLDIAYRKKQKKQTKRTERIEKIESRILRLEWTMLLLFVLQISILIKISFH